MKFATLLASFALPLCSCAAFHSLSAKSEQAQSSNAQSKNQASCQSLGTQWQQGFLHDLPICETVDHQNFVAWLKIPTDSAQQINTVPEREIALQDWIEDYFLPMSKFVVQSAPQPCTVELATACVAENIQDSSGKRTILTARLHEDYLTFAWGNKKTDH